MEIIKYLGRIFILFIFCFFLIACHEKSKKKTPTLRLATAHKQATVLDLYYKGTLNPLRTIPVLSPIDGHVTSVHFHYGAAVVKGQVLVKLSSSQLTDDYRQKLSDFLQKKDSMQKSQQSFVANQALYKAGVISQDDLSTAESTYQNDVISYYQASTELEKVLEKAGIPFKNVAKLSIHDIRTIQNIFKQSFRDVSVSSPGDGVALFPVDKTGDQSASSGKGDIIIGTEVKSGQLLLSLGDLSGFSLEIPVSEININQMHPGLAAEVTGDAFPGITLKGVVTYVAYQASPQDAGGGGDSGVSSFSVRITVPKISPEQLKIMHVGMTAQLKISIHNPERILIPIAAIKDVKGQPYVTIYDPKTGQQKDVPVHTGETTDEDIVITHGVKEGDKVVLHH